MKKQFCTYEISLALKELGFDEECLAKYNLERRLTYHPSSLAGLTVKNSNILGKAFAAPLWQQAIEWFMDEYLLEIIPRREYTADNNFEYGFAIIKWFAGGSFTVHADSSVYQTKLEATEKGILKAIEMLKERRAHAERRVLEQRRDLLSPEYFKKQCLNIPTQSKPASCFNWKSVTDELPPYQEDDNTRSIVVMVQAKNTSTGELVEDRAYMWGRKNNRIWMGADGYEVAVGMTIIAWDYLPNETLNTKGEHQ
jgi:hypothetical protein